MLSKYLCDKAQMRCFHLINAGMGYDDVELKARRCMAFVLVAASNVINLFNSQTITDSFVMQAGLSSRATKPVGHFVLAFSPRDASHLDDRILGQIAEDYLLRMGYDDRTLGRDFFESLTQTADDICDAGNGAIHVGLTTLGAILFVPYQPAISAGGGSTSNKIGWGDKDKYKKRHRNRGRGIGRGRH